MRYLAGFAGGFIVATLLLIFQQNLIGAERDAVPQPSPDVTLDKVFESRPPEEKPYDPPRQLPPEPKPPVKPEISLDPPEVVQPLPVLHDLPKIDGPAHGGVPYIRHGGQRVTDGSAVLTMPVEPVYPGEAIRNGIEGEVEVEFTVLPDGTVTDVEIVRAEPRGVFEQSALRAVQRWQFMPKRESGTPVPMRARQVIRFELPDRQ